MTKSKLLVLLAAPALLTGCAMKCDFAKFKEKVGAIDASGVNQTKLVISGKVTIGDKEEEVNFDSSETSLLDLLSAKGVAAAVMKLNNVAFYSAVENENAKYFAGTTFKYTTDELKIEWNKYGECTKIKGKASAKEGGEGYTVNLTGKYTYEKK